MMDRLQLVDYSFNCQLNTAYVLSLLLIGEIFTCSYPCDAQGGIDGQSAAQRSPKIKLGIFIALSDQKYARLVESNHSYKRNLI